MVHPAHLCILKPSISPDLRDGWHPDHPVFGDPPPAGGAPAHVPHVAVEEALPALADQAAVEQVGRTKLEVDLAQDCGKRRTVIGFSLGKSVTKSNLLYLVECNRQRL